MVDDLGHQLSVRIKRSVELNQQMKELSEAVKCLRKEKLELAIDLLARLEELNKAGEDISLLCEALNERANDIDLLQPQLDEERKEKLELLGKVRS